MFPCPFLSLSTAQRLWLQTPCPSSPHPWKKWGTDQKMRRNPHQYFFASLQVITHDVVAITASSSCSVPHNFLLGWGEKRARWFLTFSPKATSLPNEAAPEFWTLQGSKWHCSSADRSSAGDVEKGGKCRTQKKKRLKSASKKDGILFF